MKKLISRNIIFLAMLSVCFLAQSSLAKDSGWMNIRKIDSYGRYLKRNKLIPSNIKCKRPNTSGAWYSGLFKVTTVPQASSNIKGWIIKSGKVSNAAITSQMGSHFSGQSRSFVKPGKSGVGIVCEIFHMR